MVTEESLHSSRFLVILSDEVPTLWMFEGSRVDVAGLNLLGKIYFRLILLHYWLLELNRLKF
jgi:hypothetical protein